MATNDDGGNEKKKGIGEEIFEANYERIVNKVSKVYENLIRKVVLSTEKYGKSDSSVFEGSIREVGQSSKGKVPSENEGRNDLGGPAEDIGCVEGIVELINNGAAPEDNSEREFEEVENTGEGDRKKRNCNFGDVDLLDTGDLSFSEDEIDSNSEDEDYMEEDGSSDTSESMED